MVAPNNSRISKSNAKIFKFLTSVFCYLFMLTGSILIIYFANRRGNPQLLKIFYYISLGLIVSQIVLTLVKFFIQQLGYYYKHLNLIENILAIVWEAVILTTFILACVLFEAFRLDYLLITIVQGIAVILMLLYSKKIDYRVNKKYNSKIQKAGDIYVRDTLMLRKREISKSVLYLVVCFLVFVIQAGVLILPTLPPKIDDIFSENRTLKYTYYKDVRGYESGYYVAGIYFGLNDSIKIPLTYNNQPVVGILSNSISDIGIINNIQLGEYNSDGVLNSNIKHIEKNAIILNKIKTLDLPVSLKTMDADAISGNNFETVNYYSNSAFSLNSFKMSNLKTLNLKNNTEPVNIAYGGANINVNVPVDLYNLYREKFFENRKLFNVVNNDNVIVIDFETGTDHYLNSQILDKNNGQLNITSLKNPDQETSTFIKDTVHYNANKYSCDGFVSKNGYAFRGWYRDSEYALECIFNDSGNVFFNNNTTIYAKWEIIKTVELDWSNYYPYNETKTIIKYINSLDLAESRMFPKLVSNGGDIERLGFGALTWKNGDVSVEKTADLFNIQDMTVKLKAEWQLNKPAISYETKVNNIEHAGSNLTFTFDETQIINYSSAFSHESDEVAITYNWSKLNKDGTYTLLKTFTTINTDKFNYSLRNYSDSGTYKFEAIAIANTGEIASNSQNYTININKKDLTFVYDEVAPVVRTYDGNPQELRYFHTLPSTIKVTTAYDLTGAYSSLVGPVAARSEAYSIKYTFEKIDEEADNYNFAYSFSSITINPKPVTAIWTQSDLSWDVNYVRIYDGKKYNLIPSVYGVCGADNVGFILSNSPQSNAGTYMSYIIGIDNSNYTIDTYNIIDSQSWKILPKTVNAVWGQTVKEYAGGSIDFELLLSGITDNDKFLITKDSFTISSLCNTSYDQNNKKLLFSAKNVGIYNVMLSAFNNGNYDFTAITGSVQISAATLSAGWEDMVTEYNGTVQNAKLIISGFKAGDEALYGEVTLRERIIINSGCDYNILSQTNGRLVIGFAERDAASYDISLIKIINDNYLITADSNTFVINSKILNGTWEVAPLTYNGEEQNILYRIQGIHHEDAAKMLAEDFTTNIDCVRYDISQGTNYITINFYAVNAGTYSVSVKRFDTSKFGNNYVFSNEANKTFSISRRVVALTWDNNNFIYNSNQRKVQAIINNKCGDDVVNLSYSSNAATNVGTYTATVTVDNPNYTVNSTCNHDWEISKKPVEVSISGESHIYNGQYKHFNIIYSGFEQNELPSLNYGKFTYSFNYNSFVSFFESKISSTDYVVIFKAIDAKDYTITLLSTTLDNYNITLIETSFTISPLKITYYWNYSGNLIYKQSAYTVNPVFTNLCTREDTSATDITSSELTNNSKINAGSYLATLDSVTNSNYYVDVTTNSLQWEIQKHKLSVSWNNPTIIFNAAHQQKTAAATNTFGSDIISFDYSYSMLETSGKSVAVSDTINRGNYKVFVTGFSGNNSSNYILPDEEISSEYEISAKTLTALISGANHTYDGNIKYGAVLTFSGFPTSAETNNFSMDDFNYFSETSLFSKGLLNSASCTFNFGSINVGNFYTILNSSNNSNYVFNSCSWSFTVSPKVATISWTAAVHTYDGTNKTFAATISNKVANDIINIVYTFDGTSYLGNSITSNTMKDAGVYTVKIVSIDNSNYTIEGLSENVANGVLAKQFTINKKSISVSYSTPSLVYNGGYQGIALTVSGYIDNDKSLFAGNPLIYTHSGCADYDAYSNYKLSLSAVNYGTYNVAVIDLNNSFANSNYYLDSASKINTSYSIAKATISVNWSSTSLTYNGSTQEIKATINSSTIYTNSLSKEKDVINLGYSNNSAVNYGSYTASLTSIDNTNYQLPTTKTCSWTINKRTLSLSWSSSSDFVYDGKYHSVSLTVNNFVASDLSNKTTASFTGTSGSMAIASLATSGTSISLNFRNIDAGTYYYQLSSITDTNYTFSSAKYNTVIDKKTVGLSWSSNTVFDYDGTTHAIGCSAVSLCVREDTGVTDSANITLSNYSQTKAGDYTATATSISNANYALPSATTKSWSINKIILSSVWSDGDRFDYNGSARTSTLTISNFVNNDQVSVVKSNFTANTTIANCRIVDGKVCLDFTGTNAGAYEYLVQSFSNTNYDLQTVSKTVTINKLTLASSWSGNSSYVYSGDAYEVKLNISGFVNSEETATTLSSLSYMFSNGSNTIIPVLTRSSGVLVLTFSLKDVANYSLAVNSFTGINYIISNTSKTVAITKKALSVIWTGSDQLTYNGLNQGLSAFVSGLAGSDISAFAGYLNITGTYSSSYDSSGVTITFNGKNADTYNINISAKSTLLNYSIATQSKSFTIAKKGLTSFWATSTGNTSDTYNGGVKSVTLTISGIENNEKYSSSSFTRSNTTNAYDDSSAGIIRLTYNNLINVGNYSYTVSAFNNSNYSFSSTSFAYSINKLDLSVEITGNESIAYDGNSLGRTIKISGILSADLSSLSITTSNYTVSNNVNVTVVKDSNAIIITYKAKNAGTYSFGMNSIPNANYNLTKIEDKFSILQRTISLNTSSIINGGTLTFYGLAAGDIINSSNYIFSVYKDPQHLQSASDYMSVNGTYYYTIQLVNLPNYTIINNGSFTVNED